MRAKRAQAGLTLLEVVVVVATILVVASIILPSLAKSGGGPRREVACTGNLRFLGIAYRGWAEDNGGRFPAAVSRAEGGWRDFLTNGNAGRYCWTNYLIMRNELERIPRAVICPSDIRKPAGDFVMRGSPGDYGKVGIKGNCNFSYFVGVSASSDFPQSVLGGDRNLSAGSTPRDDFGLSPANDSGNDVVIRTNLASAYCWSSKMHSFRRPQGFGQILLADGSVHTMLNGSHRSYQLEAGVLTSEGTNSPGQLATPGAEFRLVFP